MEQPASVRIATYDDEDAIYDLLVDLHRHNGRGWGFPFRPEIVIGKIETGTRPKLETRTNPKDERRGIIGVVGPAKGPLIATVGLFIEPPMWFTDGLGLSETWLYVRPDARHAARLHRDLFRFSQWAHADMKERMGNSYPLSFPLLTGFVHCGERFSVMDRLWARFSGAAKVGSLFMRR